MRLTLLLGISFLFACSATKDAVKETKVEDVVKLAPTERIAVSQADVARDVTYLASDELGGRGTGSKGIEMAASYISEVFAQASVSTVPGMKRYAQNVPLVEQKPTVHASFEVADQKFNLGQDLLVLNQQPIDQSAVLKFFGQISVAELLQEDLSGAIVVTMAGSKDEGDPQAFYQLALEKQKAVAKKGGVALIELYRSPRAPFSQVSRFFGGSGLKINTTSDEDIPLIWLNDPKGNQLQLMDEAAGTACKLSLKPGMRTEIAASNVLGYIEGTDPLLANEIILVGAHYDHLGIDGSRGAADSIFNGARDNGMGTAALLGVARYFGQNPGKRPILVAGWTAEEKGLLGSKYFVQSPAVALKQIAYNLNFDGAGYNDTTSVTINGYGRTTPQSKIDEAISAIGVKVQPDPVPQMNLYQYSDNWSFAQAGIPAMNLAPGFTGFTSDLMKYYHQAGDNADDLDFAYVTRYVTACISATLALTNLETRPAWVATDPLAPSSK